MKFLTSNSKLCSNLNSVVGEKLLEKLQPVVISSVQIDKRLVPSYIPPLINQL